MGNNGKGEKGRSGQSHKVMPHVRGVFGRPVLYVGGAAAYEAWLQGWNERQGA